MEKNHINSIGLFLKRIFILFFLLLFNIQVEGQCTLNLNDVEYCNNGGAVLGVGMQLQILGVPSNGAITSYSWTGPGGFTSDVANPVLISPVTNGNYTLSVQAPGCGSISQTINVSSVGGPCPSATFTQTQTTVCDGGTINFTNQTAGSGHTYFWLFGDGSTSSTANPNHTYNVPEGIGTIPFTVTLAVVNASGHMDIEQQAIIVQQIPAEPEITSNQLQLYNGQEYLVQCTDDPTGEVFLSGVLTTAGSWVQSYTINWGDGSPALNFTTFPTPCFHEYNRGLYIFQITLNGPNSCSISNTYQVFVGNTPAGSLGSLGNTEQCAPYTFNFPINEVGNNPEGTTYTVIFSDGGASQTFSHPPPAIVSHTFTQSSCGQTTPLGFPDAFWVQISAQNPCETTINTIQPIRISTPPVANFTATPTPVCVNNPLTVNSTADPGTNVNSSGCNTNHGMVWSISPTIGWSLSSGSLGSINGQPTNYLNWTNGSDQLSVLFTIPGNYTITQRIRNSCGEDVESQTVCVVPPVTAAFNLDFNDQCAPETITTDNLTTPLNSCALPTYLWTINPSAPLAANIPPYTLNSFEPAWTLNTDTTYIITLAATNACGTTYDDTTFTVVAPPTVNLLPIPPGCAPYIVDPTVAYYDGGGTITLQEWSIDNGPWQTIIPSEPVDYSPITFLAGLHTISVRITNECGTATSTRTFTVTSPPQINLLPFSVCSGVPELINGVIPPVVIGTGAAPYSYEWTGSGITPTNVSNPSIVLTNTSSPPLASIFPISLIVTDVLGCTDTANVDVTVNPLPTLIATPNSTCIGASAVPLSVSSDILGTTFAWAPSNGLSASTGSIVQANPTTTTTYTINGTVTATGCTSSTTTELTVNPLPIVDAQAPIQLCAQAIPIAILQGTPAGGTWSDPTQLTGTLTSPNVYTPSTSPGTDLLIYTYTDINGCSNSDSVQVNVLPVESATVGADFDLCQNASPQLLNSGLPAGGIWSGPGVNLQFGNYFFDPSIAGAGVHPLTYTINTGTTCVSNASLTATVYQLPIVNAGLDLAICSGSDVTIFSSVNSGTPAYQYDWTPSLGVIGPTNSSQLQIELFNQTNTDQTYTYNLSITDANGCVVSDAVDLIVHPLPIVDAGNDQTVCTQPINYTLTDFSPTTNGIGVWTGSTQLNGNIYTPLSSVGIETLYYTFTDLNGCVNLDSIQITNVNPTTPNAGLDTSFCLNAANILIVPLTDPGGFWSGPGISPSGFFDPIVAGVGTHTFLYTINSNSTCQANDQLQITVHPIPVVNAGLDDNICSGLSSTFSSTVNSGTAPYFYSWGPLAGIVGAANTNQIIVSHINSTSSEQTYTYSLSITDSNSCTVSDDVSLIVHPLPLVDAGNDFSVCTQPIPYTLSGYSPILGGVGVWSGSAQLSGNIYTPLTLAGLDTLIYTFTDLNGCVAFDSLTISNLEPVYPDAGADTSICLNNIPFQLTATNPGGGIWSGAGVSVTGLFDPSNAGVGIHQLIYTIFPNTTCQTSDTLNIEVFSIPQVDAGLPNTICSGDTISLQGDIQAGLAPFEVQWSPIASIIGNSTSTSVDISIINTNAVNIAQAFVFQVTDANGCAVNDQVVITIRPNPMVNAGPDTSLCYSLTESYLLTGFSPLGGVWASFSGNIGTLNGLAFQTGGVGNDTLSYTFTDAFGCLASDTIVINVTSPIVINAGPNLGFCITDTIITLPMPQPVNPPATYSAFWTGAGVTNVSGLYTFNPILAGEGNHSLNYSYEFGATCAASDAISVFVGSLPQVSIADIELCFGDTVNFNANQLANTGTAPFTYNWLPTLNLSNANILSPNFYGNQASAVTLSLPYTLQVTDSMGCNITESVLITLHPLPIVDAGLNDTLCNQPIEFTLSGYSPTTGGIGVWTGNNLVGDVYTPNGLGNQTLTYTFTDQNGCINEDQKLVNVIAPIFPEAGPNRSFCLQDASIVLNPTTQPGGIWTGPGVSSAAGVYQFSPLTAGVGSHKLVYTINAGTTCETFDTLRYKVFPLPEVNAGIDKEICSGDTVALSASASLGTLPFVYLWSPTTGIISGNSTLSPQVQLFNPTLSDISQQYLIQVTDSAGCFARDSMQVLVHPLPLVDAGLNDTLCNQPIAFTLSGYSPTTGGTGVWTGNNLVGDVYTPNGLGNQTLTYTFIDLNGCVNSDQKIVRVVAPVFPDAGLDQEFCISDTAFLLTPVNNFGGVWSGSGIIQSNAPFYFDPILSDTGQFTLFYTIQPNTTCETQDSIQITVHALPLVKLGPDFGLCIDDACFQLNDFIPTDVAGGVPATGLFYSSGIISSEGLFCPAQNSPGEQMVYYQYADPTTTCMNEDSMIIQVHPTPIPLFELDSFICVNSVFQPINNSLGDTIYGGNLTYEWTILNYLNQEYFVYYGPSPQMSIADTGAYIIHLSLETQYGCIAETSQSVTIIDLPSPGFSLSSNSGCAPILVGITNTSTGIDLNYDWQVNGIYANSSELPDSILFPSPILGDTTYTVSLSVSNQCGITQLNTDFLARPTPVSVQFADTYSGCSPFVPVFTNASYGSPDSYEWVFSDGFISNDTVPEGYAFIAINNDTTIYTVMLIAENACGVDTSEIEVIALPNTVVSFFNTLPQFGCAPLNVQFLNFSSGANSYTWNFDDGSPLVNTYSANHIFEEGGIYNVSMIATDGCSIDTAFATVTVFPKPNIQFQLEEDVICEGNVINILNLSEGAAAYLWNFGNGASSTSIEPSYIYNQQGNYTIQLIGYSPVFGCPDTLSLPIQVQAKPDINIAIDPMMGCMPLFVTFTNSTTFATSMEWDFGNGQTSTQFSTNTNYYQFGDYDVHAIAHNYNFSSNLDCPVDTNIVISVFPKPESSFNLSSNASCGDSVVVSVDNLSNGATSYLWSWQQSNSFEFEPLVTLVDTGYFPVQLVASNAFACADTAVQSYRLTGQPTPLFDANPAIGCMPLNADFTSLSAYGDYWEWNFGDGNTSTQGPITQHEYLQAGNYTVSLRVSNDNTCFADTIINQMVVVHPRASAQFETDKSIITADYPLVIFENQSSNSTIFELYPGDGTQYNGFINQHIYQNVNESQYEIVLIANNQFNCPDTVSKVIKVEPSSAIYIPSSFTPNGDGRNDLFGPEIDGNPVLYNFIVFDRWGHIIFETFDKDVKWNGTFKNQDKEPIKQDVYGYQIQIMFEKSVQIREIFGRVTVIY